MLLIESNSLFIIFLSLDFDYLLFQIWIILEKLIMNLQFFEGANFNFLYNKITIK